MWVEDERNKKGEVFYGRKWIYFVKFMIKCCAYCKFNDKNFSWEGGIDERKTVSYNFIVRDNDTASVIEEFGGINIHDCEVKEFNEFIVKVR